MTPETTNEFYIDHFSSLHRPVACGATEHGIARREHGKRIGSALRAAGLPKGSRVVEIGSGTGGILAGIQDSGYRVKGYDVAPDLQFSEMPVEPGGTEALRHARDQPDAIVLCHVLEHLHDPLQALSDCAQALPAKGMVYIEVPFVEDVPKYYGSLHRYFQLAHLFHFTRCSLQSLAGLAGLHATTETTEGIIFRKGSTIAPTEHSLAAARRSYESLLSRHRWAWPIWRSRLAAWHLKESILR